MRYLEIEEVIQLHDAVLEQSGGLNGVRDRGALESALAHPYMEAFGQVLYATIYDKAAILGFLLITNHPFLDGNKRIGHAAMEAFLMLNGYEIEASVDEQETIILQVASGNCSKEDFTDWVRKNIIPLQ